MKPVTLFYQPRCPFCKKALGYLEELQRQEPYSRIEIRMIDELAEPEGAVLCPTRWRPYSVWPSTSDRRKAVFAEKGMTI